MSDSELALFQIETVTCWYCGASSGPFEREHQVPVSRGGGGGVNVVWACAQCNDLKGECTPAQFRQGLAERLDVASEEIVFAGEADSDRPVTPGIRSVRSLEADRSVVRIAPETKDELERALRFLRGVIGPNLTQRDLASEGISSYLLALRQRYSSVDEWPEPNLQLFDDEAPPPARSLTGRRTLASLPKVLQHREKTSVSGNLLDWVRAAVEYHRAHGQPDLQLVEWLDAALLAGLHSEAQRYPGFPTLDDALQQRYGPPA